MSDNRGGKREGAGRPSKGQVMMTIRVSPDIAEDVRLRAKKEKKSIGDIFSEAIKGCRK